MSSVEMNIYQKLQEVRFIVSNSIGKKSGKNAYAGFEYFELKDFVPQTISALRDYGLTSLFNINSPTETCPEVATLTITDGKEYVVFSVPTADATGKGQLPIQALGSKITYLRRYLYLIALDIVENDVVDALSTEQKDTNTTEQKVKKYTAKPDDLEKLKQVYTIDELTSIVQQNGVKKIQELDPVKVVELLLAKGVKV